jgi:Arc/MetJ-type ribon-helix-helix transcriptional regulator
VGPKTKISVTLEPAIVETLDGAVARERFASRSAAIESVLLEWVRRERAARRHAEIDAYYDGISADELAEDRALARLAARAMQAEPAPAAPHPIRRAARSRPRRTR